MIVRFGCNRLVGDERAKHARHLAQVADARRVVVRARLLHVRAHDVAFARRHAAVHLGDERELVRRIHLGLGFDAHRHRALRERGAKTVYRVVRQRDAPRSLHAVVRHRPELDRACMRLGLRVRRHVVRQHAERAALLHGLGKDAPDAAVGQNDLSGDRRLVVVGRASLPHVDERRDDAGVGRRERRDREHVAVRRPLEHRRRFADDRHARVDRVPRRLANRPMLDAIRQDRGFRRFRLLDVAGRLENILNAVDARVEAGVAGPAEILVHERDLVVRALAREERSRELEVVADGVGRLCAELCVSARTCETDQRRRRRGPPEQTEVQIPRGACPRGAQRRRAQDDGGHGFATRFMSSATAASSCGSLPVYHSPI